MYCAGSVEDVKEPMDYIFDKYCVKQRRRLYLIGNSMGANLVANYLGTEASQCPVTAACCVQPPMRMWECGDQIKYGTFGLYNYVIGGFLLKKVSKYSELLHDHYHQEFNIDLKTVVTTVKTVTDFDTMVTSIAFGYGTLNDYYQLASCVHRIPQIKVPTFILMAKDDPIIGAKAIDYDTCKKNPYVLLGVTDHGGHLGYFESIYSSKQWFTKPVFDFIDACKL